MLVVIKAENVGVGEPRWWYVTQIDAEGALNDVGLTADMLHTADRRVFKREHGWWPQFAIVDRPAPTTAPAPSPRYFHIKTDGTTPTWTIIAARPCDAWRIWVDHEDASGFLDEGHGDEDTKAPAFSMDELTASFAASRMVDDDGTRRPLTECAIGSVFCSEY